jgi:Ca2+/Na+ antiporter
MAMLKKISFLFLFMFVQVAVFAETYPSVWASEQNLSEMSVKEIIEKPWVWMLVGCVIIVAIAALIASKTSKHHQGAH